MIRSILVGATALSMLGTLGATAWGDETPVSEPRSSHLEVIGHRVVSIAPRWVDGIDGKRTHRLIGADIRIEAEAGLTAEYLTVELRRELSLVNSKLRAPDSVFAVEGSSIDVRSTGDGFVFEVTSQDSKRAQEIVRRAHLRF